MEDKTITVPSSTHEMTLDQLALLIKGDIKSLLGLTQEELEHADLDDVQKLIDAWQSVKMETAAASDVICVDGRPYLLLSQLHERSVLEMLMLENALVTEDLPMLLALHTRPAVKKLVFLSKIRREGATIKRLWKVARSGPKYLPLPFVESECRERADEFRKHMTAAQALYVSSFFAMMGYELTTSALRTEAGL